MTDTCCDIQDTRQSESDTHSMSAVLAIVNGQPVDKLPDDLYIPPDALEVFLEAFEGPLDLLLYLIRKQNLDILNIPIAAITRQYIQYVELMKTIKIELAAEYLLMAALLAEIKSRMLLPRAPVETGEEELDPRAELARRLQVYEQYKQAAEALDALPRVGRDIFPLSVPAPMIKNEQIIDVPMDSLLQAYASVLRRADLLSSHQIAREPLSVRERMSAILSSLQERNNIPFEDCFTLEEGRAGVIVTFLALLELSKSRLIQIVQRELFAPIYIQTIHDEGVNSNES